MLRFIRRVIAAFAVGLVLCVWVLQNNATFKAAVGKHLLTFLEAEWNSCITVEDIKLNFFTFSVYLNNASVLSNNQKQYAWQCEQCKVGISPLKLLLNKEVELSLILNNLKGSSAFNKTDIDIVDHIFDMFTPKSPDIHFSVASLTLTNIDLDLTHDKETIAAHLPGSLTLTAGALHTSGNHPWDGTITLAGAQIKRNNQIILDSVTGSIALAKDAVTENWCLNPNINLTSPLIDQATYTLAGTLSTNQRILTLSNTKNGVNVTGLMHTDNTVALKGVIPLTLLQRYAKPQIPDSLQSNNGLCKLDLMFVLNKDIISSEGSMVFENLKLGALSLENLVLNFTTKDAQDNNAHVNCSFAWNVIQGKGALHLANKFTIAPTMTNNATAQFTLQPDDLSITLSIDHTGKLAGTYKCAITNQATEKRYAYKGAILLGNKSFGINGATEHGEYNVHAKLWPHVHITSWHYTVGSKNIINFSQDPNNPLILKGNISWALPRSFLSQSTRRLIFGSDCTFAITLDQSDSNLKCGTIKLDSGKFYIPEFHNLIHNINTHFTLDVAAKKFTLSDLNLELSKGSVTCPRAVIRLNDDYGISLIHVPLQIDNMFINWKRDFYGFVYGNLLLNKLPERDSLLAGMLIFKKALLKDTFFSGNEPQFSASPLGGSITRYPFPCGLNLKIMTEKPIRAHTANIDALAALNLTIKATPNKDFGATPHLTGNITLTDGTLKILNNKLAIEYGKIQFIKNQLHDPIIDLIAKNRINKYMVSLQATGSLEKPTIILESTPDLTEEQIIGLLLSGSEHATLQADLPAMLLQNLDSLIWSNKKQTKGTALFDRLTKTFKYVQITPNLTDNSGKTSLKGSLSFNVSDQLRAQIHKNLTTQRDDFSANLEYLLSDEINLRAVQDQHGDRGAEIEVRLKL